MNELQAIVNFYAQARERGERAALATVVQTEGSAYRRPGARMIITESGDTCGTISGGCLERDVALRASEVIESGSSRLIEYDTRGSEEIVWGLGLGCNGVVRVLLESLREGVVGEHAVRFIEDCLLKRQSGVVATLIAYKGKRSSGDCGPELGARLLLNEKLNVCGQSLFGEELTRRISEDALEVLAGKRAVTRFVETDEERSEIFFDLITPPRPLIIFGAEHDALPLVRQAHTLGWHVTVVDTRARNSSRERFAEADKVLLCRAECVSAHLLLTESTAIVVMTHNYLDDVELLRALLPSPLCYLGILGPRKRTLKLLEEIRTDSFSPGDFGRARLHSPIGLDIGAETPEEIDVAIAAEVNGVCMARGGSFLRSRNAPIHDEHDAGPRSSKASVEQYVAVGESALLTVCHSS